jgi:23S rRNA (uridine2552-2'-O)-methyltransferase
VARRRAKGGGHWRQRQREDAYFQRAKREGYRARSAYKLQQIQEKFGVLRRGQVVLDLGAAPGSWSQVAAQIVGSSGRVIAVDLQPIEPIPGVTTLQGDLADPDVQAQIVVAAGGPVHVVLSDAAPDTSGVHLRDHVLSVELVRAALALARQALRPGGHFVAKVFEGEDLPQLIVDLRREFSRVKPNYPAATRREGREVFLVCTGFKGPSGDPTLATADTA